MDGAWNVESLAKSGLGQLVWLKSAGPFSTRAEADMIAGRLEQRHGLPTRVVPAPAPPADMLDRVYEGRLCRELPRDWRERNHRRNAVDVEFSDGARARVPAALLKRR